MTTSALEGHFFPMVPLAWALRTHGHDVLVSAPANFSDRITSAGLHAAGAVPAITFDRFMLHDREGRRLSPPQDHRDREEFGGRAWGRLAAHSLEATLALVDSFRPDLLICEPNEFAGPMAAARRGIPWAEHGWGIMTMPVFKPAAKVELAGELDTLGLAAVPEPALRIDNCPTALRSDTADAGLPMRYVPYNGSGVAPDWALRPEGRPKVLVTMGSLLPRFGLVNFVSLLRDTAEALPKLGVDVVVGVADRIAAEAGPWPPGVRTAGWLPLNAVLPACGLVIHHGGAGTTMTTVLAGRPQLVLPRGLDHYTNAERVIQAGAALSVPPEQLDAETIIEHCARLLEEPGFAVRAAEVAAKNLARPTPADVARHVAQFATDGVCPEMGTRRLP
ncbi:nucleotide disphospho-sugar-binding domain-containing protein [Streptomyces rimosus]|uniref:nucleotide disphospho-sugar-binding domain-containing protein n=1 Tax=Streptomyces rimosus TaxID=1927 RepID=UPI00131BBA6B|nr:nucleotide disphospho-sugar-binding domain-containing protein [Streptomyces rimosus]